MKNSSDVHHVPKCNAINLTIWLDWSRQYIDPQIDRKCITFLIDKDIIRCENKYQNVYNIQGQITSIKTCSVLYIHKEK